MKTTLAVMGGAALGAGLMYVADPRMGRRRRALIRDAAVHSAKVAGRGVDIGGRDLLHRAKGIFEEARGVFRSEVAPDEVLADRLRTEVGRVSSHPNVEVIVKDGCVTLLGPVVAGEERAVLKTAGSVKGVRGVINRMWTYQPDMPTQASRTRQIDIMQRHWAPATRILVGALGAAMAASATKLRGGGAAALGVAGLGLLVRAAANIGLSQATRELPMRIRTSDAVRKFARR